ncbi:MAG: rhodanese-like domain-containing protein [Alphaproteobacteria bacterium]|jgi:rhodanese-related sulfurtransferase
MNEPASQLLPQQVKQIIDAGAAYLVDVREADEYAEAHIDGATHMPLSRFATDAVRPAANQHLIIHCRSGVRCGMASDALRAAGYSGPISRMSGGLVAWIEAGLPVVRAGADRPAD